MPPAPPWATRTNAGLPAEARDRNVFLTKFPGKTGTPQDNDICIIRLFYLCLLPYQMVFILE